MSYALNAIITLPENMGSSRIAEINLGRFNSHNAARMAWVEFMSREVEDTAFDKVRTILTEDLGISLCVHFVIVEEV